MPPAPADCIPSHSHSIIMSHGNGLTWRRKFFRHAVNHRPLARQKSGFLISNANFGDPRLLDFSVYRYQSIDFSL
jgi:hypothetical protein